MIPSTRRRHFFKEEEVNNQWRESNNKGHRAENLALDYLQARGLELLARNFRSRFGEIDLLLLHRDSIAVVEVRFRTRTDRVDPLDTIDYPKQQRIRKTAEYFYAMHPAYSDLKFRFDVFIIRGDSFNHRCQWIRDAF